MMMKVNGPKDQNVYFFNPELLRGGNSGRWRRRKEKARVNQSPGFIVTIYPEQKFQISIG
jgi:hypothetical protein